MTFISEGESIYGLFLRIRWVLLVWNSTESYVLLDVIHVTCPYGRKLDIFLPLVLTFQPFLVYLCRFLVSHGCPLNFAQGKELHPGSHKEQVVVQ